MTIKNPCEGCEFSEENDENCVDRALEQKFNPVIKCAIFQEKIKPKNTHCGAFSYRLGYKWFGCSACDLNCYSKKWIREHIEQNIKMEICEGGLEFGWFGHSEAGGKCETCWVKEACEAQKLRKDIALMHIHSQIFLKNSNIQPLMGLAEYAKRYDDLKRRYNEMLQLSFVRR